jgi:DNA-binding transcriptional LysR family regulator
MFDVHLLRTFLAVSESLQFTAAGTRLGLSQSTVSQHVRRLELACGRQLIVRDTHSVSLTADGSILAELARGILDLNKQAADYFSGTTPRGKVRLGVADDLATTRFPGLLRNLIQLNPMLSVELTIGLTGALYHKLDTGRLDLVFAKRLANDPRGRLVWREHLVWIGHRDLRLAGDDAVPLIMYPSSSITSALALEALNKSGRPWFLACSSDTLTGLCAGARAGLGVMAQSRLLIDAPHGELVQIAPEAALPALGEVEFVVLGRSARLSGPVAALAELIAQRGAALWEPLSAS